MPNPAANEKADNESAVAVRHRVRWFLVINSPARQRASPSVISERIDRSAVEVNLEVEMGPRAAAGVSHPSDDLAAPHHLTGVDQQHRTMGVQCLDLVPPVIVPVQDDYTLS